MIFFPHFGHCPGVSFTIRLIFLHSGYPEHDYLYREVETKSDGKTSESAALLMTWAEQKDGSYGMVLSGEGVVTTFYRSGTFEQKN